MSTGEVVPAIVMLSLSAAAVLGSWSLGYWSNTSPGPAFLPTWIAAAGALLSILRLAEIWRARDATFDDVHWPDGVGLRRILLAAGALTAFAALSPLLGMVPSAVLFMLFLLLVVLRRPLVPSVITTAVTTGLIYAVFVFWLKVSLPIGVVGI